MALPWFVCQVLVISYSISNSLQDSTSDDSDVSDEDQFFIKYSKDGQWEPLRQKRFDEAGHMMGICEQAHKKAKLDPAEICASGFDIRMLQHSQGKYEAIPIDVIQCGFDVGDFTSMKIQYQYITKGLRQDCVFYLGPLDERARQLQLLTDLHVCGLDIVKKSSLRPNS